MPVFKNKGRTVQAEPAPKADTPKRSVTPSVTDVPLLPWERDEGPVGDEGVVSALFDALEPEFDSDTPDGDGQQPDVAASGEPDGDEPDGDESDEDDGADAEAGESAEEEITPEEREKGYLRQADYTKKTQELADLRKQVETEHASLREAREKYAALLGELEKALKESQPKEPDWDRLKARDPARYAVEWAEWQRYQKSLEDVQREQLRVQQEEVEARQKVLDEMLAAENARLIEIFPEWKDPEKQKASKRALAEYARDTYGYTPEQLNQVYDHRILVLFHKAMQFDQLQAKAQGLKPKGEIETLKPGASKRAAGAKGRQKRVQQRADRLRQTGRLADAASLIMEMLPDD